MYAALTRITMAILLVSAMTRTAGASEPNTFDLKQTIVGQIVEIDPPSSDGVHITRRLQTTFSAKPYQPLYGGDRITVVIKGVKALVRLQGVKADKILAGPSGSLEVPDAPSAPVPEDTFTAFLDQWRFVFAPGPARTAVTTTPKSAVFDASPYLSSRHQTLRSGTAQSIPIVWRGSAAKVFLLNSLNEIIASAISPRPGYALLDCPPLKPGQYQLAIGSHFFAVAAVTDQSERQTGLAGALSAASDLRSSGEMQLQSLADLQKLSKDVYVARAILENIENNP